jgi:hypothetical protein
MRFDVRSARRLALAVGMGASTLVLGACSTLQIHTDWNTSLDFSKFHTWDFQKDTLPYSTFMQERIRTAIANNLGARGLTRTETNPDLVVVWRVQRSTETQLTTTGYGGAWGAWRGGGYSTTSVQKIPIGALTLAMFDPKINQLVWRGEAESQIDENSSSAQAINEVVGQLLAQFPPKPGMQPQGNF